MSTKKKKLLESYKKLVKQAEETENRRTKDAALKKAIDIAWKYNQLLIDEIKEKTTLQYTVEAMEMLSVCLIAKENLTNITDLCHYLPITRETFYEKLLHKSYVIKQALSIEGTKTKSILRKKWLDSDNSTVQIALYKLLASDEEFERLTTNNMNVQADLYEGEDKNSLDDKFGMIPEKDEYAEMDKEIDGDN